MTSAKRLEKHGKVDERVCVFLRVLVNFVGYDSGKVSFEHLSALVVLPESL